MCSQRCLKQGNRGCGFLDDMVFSECMFVNSLYDWYCIQSTPVFAGPGRKTPKRLNAANLQKRYFHICKILQHRRGAKTPQCIVPWQKSVMGRPRGCRKGEELFSAGGINRFQPPLLCAISHHATAVVVCDISSRNCLCCVHCLTGRPLLCALLRGETVHTTISVAW